ncbi:MAG TPA: hypothetical protein VHD32_12520 [Candidatus Didemnitutus sp.]|nr:hypothetical protein [Candidatus Didemnitutus sp.]
MITIGGIRIRRRLFVGFGLVVAACLGWYYWTKARQLPAVTQATVPEPFVKLVNEGADGANRVLAEQAEYFDPTPLFIPTAHNFGQGPLPARVVRQPGQIFNDISPNLTFKERALANYAFGYQSEAASVSDILEQGNEAPFAGFEQVDGRGPTISQRIAYLSIKSMKTGMEIMGQSLPELKLPTTEFAPMDFLALVGNSGFVGEPLMTSGSGSEEVDGAVRKYLAQKLRLGDRLPPGQYVVSVGP